MSTTTPAPLATLDWRHSDLWGPPIRKRWTAWDIPAALGWLIAMNVLASVPALWLMSTQPEANPTELLYSPLVLTSGFIALWSVFVGYPLFVTYRRGRRSLAQDFGWRFRPRDVLIGLGLGVLLRGVDIGMAAAAGTVIDMSDGDNSAWLFLPRPLAWTVFYALGAAIIAPALEELFFRGFLLRSIARVRRIPRRLRAHVAILGSSVLFGAMHITALTPSGLYVVVVTGSLGAIMALLAVKTGRLGPGVMTHIVFNSTGVLMAFLAH